MNEELWNQLVLSVYSYAHGDNEVAAKLIGWLKPYSSTTFPLGNFRMWLYDLKEVLEFTEKLGILPLERPMK